MDEATGSTTTATAELAAAPGHEAPGHGDIGHAAHGHPGPFKYVMIAVILAVVTAVEVALYYINLPAGLLVALLLGLAFIKFSMVAAYFMHLKFDSRLLRRVFVTGIVLAAAVYTVALVTLGVLVG